METSSRFAGRLRQIVLAAAVVGVWVAPVKAEETSRLDLPKIARQIKARGLAEYIPVAYKTAGIDDEHWIPADNYAKAHFCLYMAKDCSHFVLKWEIPALIPATGEGGPEQTRETRPAAIYGGPGPGKYVFKNSIHNAILSSCSVGRMQRIWTKGPLNLMADAAHEGPAGSPDKWGALIHCGLYLSGGEAALADPIAIYCTPGSAEGDPLSGGCVMDVTPSVQKTLQNLVKTRGFAQGVAPVYWRVCASLFNVTVKNYIAELKEVKVQADVVGTQVFRVVDVFVFVVGAAEETACEIAIDLLLDFAMDQAGVPSTWDIVKWVLFLPVNKVLGELGKVTDVRVGYMPTPEPFQIAPWTFVQLEGPDRGKDTWDQVEMRGGYVGRGKYTWKVGAGAITDWGAAVSFRPSVIMLPQIYAPSACTWSMKPNVLEVELHRSDSNWEAIDQWLSENYLGQVNAPVFQVSSEPLVNYEIFDQEVLRATGKESMESGGDFTRRQIFKTISLCSGAERLYGRNGRIDFDAKHEQAVSLDGKSMAVDVTFERGVMPQGGFTITRQGVQAARTVPLISIGKFGDQTLVTRFSDTWWWQTGKYWKEKIQDQRAYWMNRRSDLVNYWRRDTQEQVEVWRQSWGPFYALQHGYVVYNPDARHFTVSKAADQLKFAYLPSYQGLTFEEPLVWERVVTEKSATELPDLGRVQPEISWDGKRLVVSYKNPKTGQDRALILKAPAPPPVAKRAK